MIYLSIISLTTDQLYIMNCEWNYRSDHCKYHSVCKSAEQNGVAVLHGSKRGFFPEKQPTFAAVFNTFRNVSYVF